MKNRIIASLLLLFILINISYCQKAEANEMALAGAGAVMIGAGLVAAGVYPSAKSDFNAAVTEAYNNMPDSFKQKMVNLTAIGFAGYAFTKAEWDTLRNHVQTKYHTGAGNQASLGTTIKSGSVGIVEQGVSQITIGADVYTYTLTDGDHVNTGGQVQLYKNGSVIRNFSIDTSDKYVVNGVTLVQNYGSYCLGFWYMLYRKVNGVWTPYDNQWYSRPWSDPVYVSGNMTYNGSISATYTGDAVLGNPGWDWPGEDGERKVGIPLSPGQTWDQSIDVAWNQVGGKDKSSVIDTGKDVITTPTADTDITNPSLPNVGTETGTITGWLGGIAGLLKELWDWLAETLQKILDWIKKAIVSLATIVEWLTAETSGDINWQPLKATGIVFTNVFPFSLPWDFKRTIEQLNYSGSFEPIIHVNLHTILTGDFLKFDIDMGMWSSVLPFVRGMELLIFDLILILATRKLLGGAQ